RGKQRSFITATLCRDDDIAGPGFVDLKCVTFNTPIDIAKGGLLIRRRASCDGKSGALGEVGDGDGDRTRPTDDDVSSRQARLHEYVHRTLARAHVSGKADTALLFARRMALLVEQVWQLHRDQTRFAIGQGILGRLEHLGTRAAASDPPL